LALLVLTVAYYAVPWRSVPLTGAVVGLPFLLLYCVFVPGFSLSRRFGRGGRDALEEIADSAFYGFGVLLAGAFVWTLSGVSIEGFAYSLPLAVVAVGLTAPLGGRGDPPPRGASESASGRRWTKGLAAFALVVGALVLWSGPPIDYGKDTLDYVAYTHEVARSGEPFPTSEFYADAGPYGADLRKGLLHALYGYFKWYLGVDALTLFRGLGAVFLVLVTFAVYAAGRAFFPGRAVAALAGALFLIGFDGGLDSALIRAFFYPSRFAIGYLLLFLISALEYMVRPRPRGLVFCALFAFAAAAVHIQYAVLLGFAVATIVVWKTCFNAGSYREHLWRSVSLGIAAFMGMLPYAMFRYMTAYQTGGSSELHRQIQGAVFVADGWFMSNPVHSWESVGLLGVAAVLAIVPLWRRRREHPALGYLIASLLSVVLVQYNPLLMPVFYRFITYLVYRLGTVSPFYIIAAYFVVAASKPERAGSVALGRFRRPALAVMLVAIVVGLAPIAGKNAFSPSTLKEERENSYLRWESGLLALNGLPEGSVIASDPITSYAITAFTPHKVVCTFDQHAPPGDLFARDRTIAARDILSPFTSVSDKAHQVAAHGVTHVVVNHNLGPLRMCDYWTVSDKSVAFITGMFAALDDYFDEDFHDGDIRVYRVTGESPRQVATIRNPLLRRQVPVSADRVGETAGLARVEAAGIAGLDSIPPGDSIEVTMYWIREGELPLDKYIVSIRFNRLDQRLPLGGWPFPKVVRKVKESIDGVRYRFRQDHMIVDGFVSPDTWPPGVFVLDRTTVQIPEDLAAGRYAVRAKLLTRATSPNYRLRDFLYDDDVHEGAVIGEIKIGRTE
jgi:hypothetical protein